MNFTVIGSRGFVGRRLCELLETAGHDVHRPSREQSDWTDIDLGVVFYCAGLTADFAQRPLDTLEAHVSQLVKVLSQARYSALVYLSSTRLYDDQMLPVALETDPLLLNPNNPRHLFDLSKACGEAACLALGGGKARVARLSCVYSNEQDSDGFLGQLLRQLLPRKALGQTARSAPLAWDTAPNLERDYVHLDDVVQALLAIALRGQRLIYNVASGENLSNQHLFNEIARVTGVQPVATRSAQILPRAARIDTQALHDDLACHPRRLIDSIEQLWAQA